MSDEALLKRFWGKVAIKGPDECWEWQGYISTNGYGQFSVGRKPRTAHRWIYQEINGALPANILACHKCDNRKCCNPSHLFAGTSSDNQNDCVRKGRHYMGRDNAKLNEQQIREIRARYIPRQNGGQLAQEYGIGLNHLIKITSGKQWKGIT